MAYSFNQNSLRRWDNLLANLRREILTLRKLVIRNTNGNLVSNKGSVTSNPVFGGGSLALGRIYLTNTLNYDPVNITEIIDPTQFTIDYQYPSADSGLLLLQNNHHCTIPSILNDIALNTFTLYVKVEAILGLQLITSNNYGSFITFQIVRNNTDILSTSYFQFVDNNTDFSFSYLKFTIDDVVKCNANDTIDIFINMNENQKAILLSNLDQTYINFNVIAIDTST